MDADAWFPVTGLVLAAVSAVLGWFVPAGIARIPEPDSEDPDPEKEPYRAIAALPGLAWKCALTAAVVGGLLGLRVGWEWTLLPLVYLVPVGVGLALVDWRTRLLPTRVVNPSYLVVGALVLVAAALERDTTIVVRAAIGLVVVRGIFELLNRVYSRGMGYGDVRLSGVLALALGAVGWMELLVGTYVGFLLGGLIGAVLAMLRVVDRRGYPFGPFMLAGAVVGVLTGPWLAGYLVSGSA